MAYDPHLTPISVDRQRGAAPRAARPTGGPAGADVSDVPNAIPLSPVNYRLLVVTVIGISAGMWGISALHGYQLDRIANEFRVLGDQAREAGDTEAAIGHLQRTLAIVPEDIAAIEGLAFSIAETAKTMAETAKTTAETAKATAATYRATQLFERILRNSPNATGVRRKLVELYVDLSRHASTFSSDAVEHLDQLLKKDPGNPQLRVLRGESLENLGRFAEARADYEIAIESAPRDFETYDRLVRLLSSRLDKPNEALSRLNELVQRNLKNPAAYLARSRFHWEQGRVRESRIDAVRAYRLDSEDPDVLIFLVTLMSYADWPSSPVTAEQLRDRLSRHAPDGDSRRTTEL
ncbi:MAG: tetratricopeptide repeat protein, partial [Planctomycetaceae bacterium]